MGSASYLSFYLLLAVFGLGLASTLGVDDFLVTFFAVLSILPVLFSNNLLTTSIPRQFLCSRKTEGDKILILVIILIPRNF